MESIMGTVNLVIQSMIMTGCLILAVIFIKSKDAKYRLVKALLLLLVFAGLAFSFIMYFKQHIS